MPALKGRPKFRRRYAAIVIEEKAAASSITNVQQNPSWG
jgi:hypothetical protein